MSNESRDQKNARLAVQMGVGATGAPPTGKYHESDQGGLKAAVVREGDDVVVYFGKTVGWVAMSPDEALAFAQTIVQKAGHVAHVGEVSPVLLAAPELLAACESLLEWASRIKDVRAAGGPVEAVLAAMIAVAKVKGVTS